MLKAISGRHKISPGLFTFVFFKPKTWCRVIWKMFHKHLIILNLEALSNRLLQQLQCLKRNSNESFSCSTVLLCSVNACYVNTLQENNQKTVWLLYWFLLCTHIATEATSGVIFECKQDRLPGRLSVLCMHDWCVIDRKHTYTKTHFRTQPHTLLFTRNVSVKTWMRLSCQDPSGTLRHFKN